MLKRPITSKKQITLNKDLLHPAQSINRAFNLLNDKISGKVATLEEINQVIVEGWTGNKK